jgi:PAS domain S-box-containing protein
MNTEKSSGEIAEVMNESLEDFLDKITVAVHLVDRAGIIVYANKAELKLLGYQKEEYIGHNIKEFHVEENVIDNIFSKLIGQEDLENEESKLKCKDGSVIDVVINSNVHFEDHQFKHTRCFTRDITRLKKVENLLRLLNKAGEEISATLDTQEALDKITTFIVPHFADWFVVNELRDDGYAYLLKMAHTVPAQVTWAENYRRAHPISLNDPKVGSVGWVLRTGEGVLNPEITDKMIEEGAMDAEQAEILKALSIKSVMIVPMQIKGKINGVVSFISCNPLNKYDEYTLNFAKDFANRIALTLENARLYEEIKKDINEKIQADKQKDEFISIASHELKTPVTSLKGYTQILQMLFEEQKDSVASDMLSKMNKQIDKLTLLITEMLDITKIDNGQIAFNFSEFDFNELVKEIAAEMQNTTKTHKISVQLGKKIKIKADRNRTAQVMINLISNAIKYSPGQDNVLITVKSPDRQTVRFCVRDFGIGIPAEQQSKIFNRFYRVSGENKYTFPGVGLGLYISSEIIKRHCGTISFKSKEGAGSTFCFQLPGS